MQNVAPSTGAIVVVGTPGAIVVVGTPGAGNTLLISVPGAGDASPSDSADGLHYAFDLNGDGHFDVGDGTYAGSTTA